MFTYGRRYVLYRRMAGSDWLVGVNGIDIQSEEEVTAVRSHGKVFIMPDSTLAKYFRQLFKRVEKEQNQEQLLACFAIIQMGEFLFDSPETVVEKPFRFVPEVLDRIERGFAYEGLRPEHSYKEAIDMQELIKVVGETRWVLFNPSSWERRSEE